MSKYDGIPTIADYIADRAVGCRNCGYSFERTVRPDGTVEPCEHCGDGSYNLFDYSLLSSFAIGDSARDRRNGPGWYGARPDRIGKVVSQHITVEVEYPDGKCVLYHEDRLERFESKPAAAIDEVGG